MCLAFGQTQTMTMTQTAKQKNHSFLSSHNVYYKEDFNTKAIG